MQNLKISCYTLLLFLLSQNTYSQCSLNQPIPDNQADLETLNFAIASCYAPTINQLALSGLSNSAGGLGDLILPINFDGDFDVTNNWDNLESAQGSQLNPLVYFSVVWTNAHWLITYAFYHPRDYSGTDELCCLDNHINDLEGAIFVVNRSTETVTGAYTISHNDLIEYNNVSSVPTIFIDNATHAVEANLYPFECIATPLWPCDDCVTFDNPIVYNLSTNGTASLSLTPSLSGTGSYILEDIFSTSSTSLWNLRNNTNVFVGDKFATGFGIGCQYNGTASAPWGWGQFDYYYDEIEYLIDKANGVLQPEWRNIPPPNSPSTNSSVVILDNPYYNHCYDKATSISIISDFEWDLSEKARFEKIRVESGVSLTIKDKDIQFISNGVIELMEGSSLILENTRLRGCENFTWQGIRTPIPSSNNPITIDMQISKIEDAEIGISNQYYTSPGWEESGTDLDLNLFATFFKNNIKAFELYGAINHELNYTMYGNTFDDNLEGSLIKNHQIGTGNIEGSDFFNCPEAAITFYDVNVPTTLKHVDFANNLQGIRIERSKDIAIASSVFSSDLPVVNELLDNPIGISSFESEIQVNNNNRFIDIPLGVVSEGTFELSANIIVGNIDHTANRFSNNIKSIYLRGNDNARIVNNIINPLITEFSTDGIYLDKKNNFFIANNTVENSLWGLRIDNTGTNLNRISCNSFKNSFLSDNYILEKNDKTIFINNLYEGNAVGLQLQNASIAVEQTFLNTPSSNCFSMGKPEIEGSVQEVFNYHHFDDQSTNDHCEEPNNSNSGLFNQIYYDDEFDHCGSDGVGATNIPPIYQDPDLGTLEPISPDPTKYTFGCDNCIVTEVNNAANQIITNGGDNPYTYIEENSANANVDGVAEFYAWMNFGLTVALENEDYAFAESLLQPFQAYEWQSKLFGIYILQRDYNSAQVLNDNLPANTMDEQDLKFINQVNINRHTALPNKYTMTSTEDQALYDIALKDTPISGYAASLHRYLTGSSFRTLQNNNHHNTPRVNYQRELKAKISIFPNPLESSIRSLTIDHSLQAGINIENIRILSTDGRKIYSNLKLNDNTIHLPIMNDGLYFIQFYLCDGHTISKSFIVR